MRKAGLLGNCASDDDCDIEKSNSDWRVISHPQAEPSTMCSDQDDPAISPAVQQKMTSSVTVAATIHPAPRPHCQALKRVTPKPPATTIVTENVRLDKMKARSGSQDVLRNETITSYYHSDSESNEINESPTTELGPPAKKLIVQNVSSGTVVTPSSTKKEVADVLLNKVKDKSNVAEKLGDEMHNKKNSETTSPEKKIDDIGNKKLPKKVTNIAQIDMISDENVLNGSGPSTPKQLSRSSADVEVKSLFPIRITITEEIPKSIFASAMNIEENPMKAKRGLLQEADSGTDVDDENEEEEDMDQHQGADSENFLYEEDEDIGWLQGAVSGSDVDEEIEEEEDIGCLPAADSGSEIFFEEEEEEEIFPKGLAKYLRYRLIAEEEGVLWKKDWVDKNLEDLIEEWAPDVIEGSGLAAAASVSAEGGAEVATPGRTNTNGEVQGICSGAQVVAEDSELCTDFVWSADFATFSGQAERYTRTPGPQVGTQDPTDLFMLVWDRTIVNKIVKQTNEHARDSIASRTGAERYPKELDAWHDVSADVIYRMFGMFILMSLNQRFKVNEYWCTGPMEMQKFRSIMSLDDFSSVLKYLDFTDHRAPIDSTLPPYQRIIFEIQPLIDHCNHTFTSLYIPNKHLSLDESLVLWKDPCSWILCIRDQAASIGIKSVDLCEAETGYLLRCSLYAGDQSSFRFGVGTIQGFNKSTVKDVLELMDGYLDVGHCLVMDNWYKQLVLTRHLKTRKTDVIGSFDHRRAHVPDEIKAIDENLLKRGDQVARHCGDVTLIAWKDMNLVATISTYHKDEMVSEQGAGQTFMKPSLVLEHSKYMGVADGIKKEMQPTYLLDRKHDKKWYIRVFKWLLDTSLLNAYIIYLRNPITGRILTHRQFRIQVAEGILQRFRRCEVTRPLDPGVGRLNFLQIHSPMETGSGREAGARRKQERCIRCKAAGKRVQAPLKCVECNAPLCGGQCWRDYHTLRDLTKIIDQD